jgi:hypothetical protein
LSRTGSDRTGRDAPPVLVLPNRALAETQLRMTSERANRWLIAAGTGSALAAVLHLGCVAFGAPWYRFFGAGERMAQLAIAGSPYPTFVTLCIAGMLAIWSLYALSGAGAIRRLPLLRSVLCAITAVYLLRGVIALPFVAQLPERSPTFWYGSSAICFALGALHLIGLRQVWARLSVNRRMR